MKTYLMLAAIALLSAPASAQDAATPPQAEKKICKTQKMTGSLTRRTRICMTESEWRQQTQQARAGVDGIVRDAGVNVGSAGSPPGGGM